MLDTVITFAAADIHPHPSSIFVLYITSILSLFPCFHCANLPYTASNLLLERRRIVSLQVILFRIVRVNQAAAEASIDLRWSLYL